MADMTERENYVELIDATGSGDVAHPIRHIRINGKPVIVTPDGVDLCMVDGTPQITLTILPSELTFIKEN